MADPMKRVAARVATIAGAAVLEPYDVRLAALWRHDGAVSYLHPEYRASLINEASKLLIEQGGQA